MKNTSYYPGNKNIPGLIQKIVNQIPPCVNFYEPFAGSAAVSTFLSIIPGVKLNYYINDLDERLTAKTDYPTGSIVSNNDFSIVLNKLITSAASNDNFVFIDSPYLHSTRINNINLYDYEFSDSDHLKLLSTVRNLKCNCMIIHPVCALYNQALHSFRTVQLTIRYHNKTSIENLYMNYPRPKQLLTYAVAGTDCWDRQRIKRKGDRLVQKLSSLPAVERNYIIDRLVQSFKT